MDMKIRTNYDGKYDIKPLGGWILCTGRQAVFFIPIILMLPKFMGLNGVIAAQPIADIITIIIMGILAVKLNGEIKHSAKAQASNANLNVMGK